MLLSAVAACDDKKGDDTRILELDAADAGLADYFLITSASNDRQAVTIADEIEFRLKKEFGIYPASVEGRRQAEWILLDYVDLVIHVFLAEKRAFYDIERLRKSARTLTSDELATELKTALVTKTKAVRKSTAAKRAAVVKAAPKKAVAKKAAKAAAKKIVAKKAVAKKATAKKPAAKTVAVKKVAASKVVSKAATKPAVKRAAAKSSGSAAASKAAGKIKTG